MATPLQLLERARDRVKRYTRASVSLGQLEKTIGYLEAGDIVMAKKFAKTVFKRLRLDADRAQEEGKTQQMKVLNHAVVSVGKAIKGIR